MSLRPQRFLKWSSMAPKGSSKGPYRVLKESLKGPQRILKEYSKRYSIVSQKVLRQVPQGVLKWASKYPHRFLKYPPFVHKSFTITSFRVPKKSFFSTVHVLRAHSRYAMSSNTETAHRSLTLEPLLVRQQSSEMQEQAFLSRGRRKALAVAFEESWGDFASTKKNPLFFLLLFMNESASYQYRLPSLRMSVTFHLEAHASLSTKQEIKGFASLRFLRCGGRTFVVTHEGSPALLSSACPLAAAGHRLHFPSNLLR